MTIVPPTPAAEPVPAPGQVARKYQEEIFRQAQKGNVIAYLRTGLGKTLISVLLIRWMCAQESAKDKAIIFLVPKVSLVEQQAAYIEKETGLKTCRLHGALSTDFGKREVWKSRFEKNTVFVITPQLFLEMVSHSLWAIDKCSLIIFDECHHTRKNHPYNGIMREYFQVKDIKARPKIFGMTASPYWNQKNPALSLSTLEANLNSKIMGVHEHVEELQNHYSQLQEEIYTYPFPPEQYDFHEPTLYQCMKVFQANHPTIFTGVDITWSKLEMRYNMTLNNLGPYSASLYIYWEMRYLLDGILLKARKVINEYEDYSESSLTAMDTDDHPAATRLPPVETFDLMDILDEYEPFFVSATDPNELPVDVRLRWCTPKVRILVSILQAHLTDTTQCIIFVEQRQTAFCLSRILGAIPTLRNIARCGHLVGGHGTGETMRMSDTFKGDAIKLFREKRINTLIATSVAEEGLDFPACELVIRFDALQHLVGYVQSRGRARSKVSKYIVMIQQDNEDQIERYRELQRGEHELTRTYQTKRTVLPTDDEVDNEQDTHPMDYLERERYVVPSTGAILTYDNAMGLLSHLCSLIPRDIYTPATKPIYTGEFQARLRLPAGLPLSPRDLTYIGYPKRTKKEARRCVAFGAVKRLLRLNVFDEYLLPTSHEEDPDNRSKANNIKGMLPPETMVVDVKDPWDMNHDLWIHPLAIDSAVAAGLVTGTSLPSVDMSIFGSNVELLPPQPLHLHPDDEVECRRIMDEFMQFGIYARVVARPYVGSPTFALVPLTTANAPDYTLMTRIVDNQKGVKSWGSFNLPESEYKNIWIFNWNETGRIYGLTGIRNDLTPMSSPPPDSREAQLGSTTFSDYYLKKWTRKKHQAWVPSEGPLLEAVVIPRTEAAKYDIHTRSVPAIPKKSKAEGTFFLPRDCCRFLYFPETLSKAFGVLPVLHRAATDLYRARQARFALRLPSLPDTLIFEALTIPGAMLAYNNQRLETLGDSVLKLCTSMHLFHHYPNRHEGQLSEMRVQYISNKFLLRRALEVGLERYLTTEAVSSRSWRFYDEERGRKGKTLEERGGRPSRTLRTAYPRRSLQDCMEALLGASFVHGGIVTALRTGTALGVNMGGPLPWHMRYGRPQKGDASLAKLFDRLSYRLGYQFKSNSILVEAVTHPSFASDADGPSYQRLEFLGDAVLDLVVIRYLYDKFPDATSHQLSLMRQRVICSPALAWLAVKKLELHRIMLVNNTELYRAIEKQVKILESVSEEEIVNSGWKFDPPKAISDVFESILGAMMIDSGYNYEKTASILEGVMCGLLECLTPDLSRDPITAMMEWAAKGGCLSKAEFRRQRDEIGNEGIVVYLHDRLIVGPITASTLAVAKFIAAQRAYEVLSDEEDENHIKRICDCASAMAVDDHLPSLASEVSGLSLDDTEAVSILVPEGATDYEDIYASEDEDKEGGDDTRGLIDAEHDLHREPQFV